MLKKNKAPKYAFTFMELLIVLVLTALIGLAVYSVFAQGVRVWQRLSQRDDREDAVIFFDKIARDLTNSVKYESIPFIGSKNEMRFAVPVVSQTEHFGLEKNIGEVTYSFPPEGQVLMRYQKNLSQLYMEKEVPGSVVLTEFRRAVFMYYFYDPQKKEYSWEEEYIRQGLPEAVRIEIDFGGVEAADKIIRTVTLPVSGSLK